MTQTPEYIIGGTKVEVGQVYEARNGMRFVIDALNRKQFPIKAGTDEFTKNGCFKLNEATSEYDLIKCVGRVVPLVDDKAQEPVETCSITGSEIHSKKKLELSAEYCHKEIIEISYKIKECSSEVTTFDDNLEKAIAVFIRASKAMNNNPELMEYLAC